MNTAQRMVLVSEPYLNRLRRSKTMLPTAGGANASAAAVESGAVGGSINPAPNDNNDIDDDDDDDDDQQQDAQTNVVISTLPKTLRSKGASLIGFLRTNGIRHDEKHQLLIGGKPVLGSNFTDVIHDLVRMRGSVTAPVGFPELAVALRDANISRELIGNHQRYDSIKRGTFTNNDNEGDNAGKKRTPEVSPSKKKPQKTHQYRFSPYQVPDKLSSKPRRFKGQWIKW